MLPSNTQDAAIQGHEFISFLKTQTPAAKSLLKMIQICFFFNVLFSVDTKYTQDISPYTFGHVLSFPLRRYHEQNSDCTLCCLTNLFFTLYNYCSSWQIEEALNLVFTLQA